MIPAHRLCVPAVRAAAALLLSCLPGAACGGGTTVWSRELRSPDGRWVALAHTEQWSGPGNAAVVTSVELRRTDGGAEPITVLGLSQDRPAGVGLAWPSATHLDISYRGPASADLQVVRAGGVEITLRDLAGPADAPQPGGAGTGPAPRP